MRQNFQLPGIKRIRKEKIFLVEGILKVRKKSGNRERCRKLSYEIASENTRDITTHPSKDMTSGTNNGILSSLPKNTANEKEGSKRKDRCSGSYRLAVGFLVIKDESISERPG